MADLIKRFRIVHYYDVRLCIRLHIGDYRSCVTGYVVSHMTHEIESHVEDHKECCVTVHVSLCC